MARPAIDDVRRALGADEPQTIHAAPHGPFGALQLAAELAERLQPGRGARAGRPTDPEWTVRRLVGFRRETWQRLRQLAANASTPQRQVSPAQVAAMLVESGVERLRAG
jgi:hypothetical protein